MWDEAWRQQQKMRALRLRRRWRWWRQQWPVRRTAAVAVRVGRTAASAQAAAAVAASAPVKSSHWHWSRWRETLGLRRDRRGTAQVWLPLRATTEQRRKKAGRRKRESGKPKRYVENWGVWLQSLTDKLLAQNAHSETNQNRGAEQSRAEHRERSVTAPTPRSTQTMHAERVACKNTRVRMARYLNRNARQRRCGFAPRTEKGSSPGTRRRRNERSRDDESQCVTGRRCTELHPQSRPALRSPVRGHTHNNRVGRGDGT